ncbi:NAD(P)-dependent oxidoreductase [Candidatus Magnetomoraceae bacterium gMMP-15]
MYLQSKTVFLSGATGLVGTSIIQYILDNYPTTRIKAIYNNTKPFIYDERIEYVQCDLRVKDNCREAVKSCDCAIMAAANTGGSYQLTVKPWHQINDNLIMNAQMLEAFYFENIKRVIYIGSATLYQEFQGLIREDSLDLNKDPHKAYFGIGWVIRYIEKLCRFWNNQCNMEILIARAANIFGPYAKFNPLTSNFIPAIIRKAVDKMNPFEVWGSPDVTRDVIYSEDFAKAVVMMLDNDSIKFETFNIGSGVKTTVENVVKWSLKYAGHSPYSINYRHDKPITIKFRSLDCTKANELLGWQPHYTIEEGINKTTQWWIDNYSWWKK